MVACGSGGTAEGDLSTWLLTGAIARYEGVGDKKFERIGFLSDTMGTVASESKFPALRPTGTFRLPESIAAIVGETWETDIEQLVRSRLADDAYRVVDTAVVEAALLGHEHVTTGHLLLALAMSESSPATALRSLGLAPESIRALLQSAPLSEGEQSPENTRFTDTAARLLLRDSNSLGYKLSVTEVFHRVVDAATGVAASIITVHDLTAEQVKERFRLLRRH